MVHLVFIYLFIYYYYYYFFIIFFIIIICIMIIIIIIIAGVLSNGNDDAGKHWHHNDVIALNTASNERNYLSHRDHCNVAQILLYLFSSLVKAYWL